jgi:hypothetical protein
VQPPVAVPTVHLPGLVGAQAPLATLPPEAADLAAATYAFGDPVADQAYYRARMPVDLALNGAARRGADQSLYIRGFSNDAVPRQASDFSSPPGYIGAQAFESIVLASNAELNRAFATAGVQAGYQLHPGIHSDAYWNPWLREEVAALWARLRQPGGGGHPPPAPSTFDYRSAAPSFAVWGWQVQVSRPTEEYLEMDGVTCSGLTLRGTGQVTLTVPAACGTGMAGARTVHVDLGPAMPTDAPAGADGLAVYGRTVHVPLAPLRPA